MPQSPAEQTTPLQGPRALTVMVPALNEAAAIETTVREALAHARDKLDDYRLILIDDGSTDETGALMDRLAAEDPKIRVVHNPHPKGVGAGFALALAEAQTPYITVIPGDHAFHRDGVGRLFAAAGRSDLVVSYRDNQASRSQLRSLQSHALIALINLLFGYWLRDYHSMVVYPVRELRALAIDAKGYAYQVEAVISLLRMGLSHEQVQVSLNPELKGSSRALRLKTYLDLGRTLLRLRLSRAPKRPPAGAQAAPTGGARTAPAAGAAVQPGAAKARRAAGSR